MDEHFKERARALSPNHPGTIFEAFLPLALASCDQLLRRLSALQPEFNIGKPVSQELSHESYNTRSSMC